MATIAAKAALKEHSIFGLCYNYNNNNVDNEISRTGRFLYLVFIIFSALSTTLILTFTNNYGRTGQVLVAIIACIVLRWFKRFLISRIYKKYVTVNSRKHQVIFELCTTALAIILYIFVILFARMDKINEGLLNFAIVAPLCSLLEFLEMFACALLCGCWIPKPAAPVMEPEQLPSSTA